jgi:hypothetical protein
VRKNKERVIILTEIERKFGGILRTIGESLKGRRDIIIFFLNYSLRKKA